MLKKGIIVSWEISTKNLAHKNKLHLNACISLGLPKLSFVHILIKFPVIWFDAYYFCEEVKVLNSSIL